MGRLVAIVGRPNVGKSTLFNRLTQTRTAIVDDTSGTTRDRQYGKVDWCGQEFSIVDTGGWVVNSEDIFEGEINKQVSIAIEEADVILFVVDVRNGVTDLDDMVAQILRRSKKLSLWLTKPTLTNGNTKPPNSIRSGSATRYASPLLPAPVQATCSTKSFAASPRKKKKLSKKTSRVSLSSVVQMPENRASLTLSSAKNATS